MWLVVTMCNSANVIGSFHHRRNSVGRHWSSRSQPLVRSSKLRKTLWNVCCRLVCGETDLNWYVAIQSLCHLELIFIYLTVKIQHRNININYMVLPNTLLGMLHQGFFSFFLFFLDFIYLCLEKEGERNIEQLLPICTPTGD